MKTDDILLLSNSTYGRGPARRIFVGHDRTIAWLAIIFAVCVIAIGIVATAIAGFKRDEVAIHRSAEAILAADKQVRRGGPLSGYPGLW